jgi:hypothetical protein
MAPVISGGIVIPGVEPRSEHADVVITSAQVLALNATPIQLVAAPGTGKYIEFISSIIHKPAGTAYGGIAAGEDLSVKYTDGSGLELGGCEATGFLDQAGAVTRNVRAYRAASGVSEIIPTEDAALVMHMLVGEIITGDSNLNVQVEYKIRTSNVQ